MFWWALKKIYIYTCIHNIYTICVQTNIQTRPKARASSHSYRISSCRDSAGHPDTGDGSTMIQCVLIEESWRWLTESCPSHCFARKRCNQWRWKTWTFWKIFKSSKQAYLIILYYICARDPTKPSRNNVLPRGTVIDSEVTQNGTPWNASSLNHMKRFIEVLVTIQSVKTWRLAVSGRLEGC